MVSNINPPEVVSMLGLLDTYQRHKSINGGPRNYSIYHPSAFGKCLRYMQYQRFAEEGIGGLSMPVKEHEGRVQRIF